MKTIWKYPLPEPEMTLDLELGAEIVMFECDNKTGHLCLWALLNTDIQTSKRKFIVHGTGHRMGGKRKTYLKSCQAGDFVWHLFEQEVPFNE